MKNVKRNVKAISPVLAVLMMIAVAIAGSLITYAWVTGYIGFTTDKAGQAIMIQSIANTTTGDPAAGLPDLTVYVQNVGEGAVTLDKDTCLYVNGVLPLAADITMSPEDGLIGEGDTATLTVAGAGAGLGEKVTVKVTSLLGTFTEKSAYPYIGGGGTSTGTPTPPPDVNQISSTDTGFSGVLAGDLLVVIPNHRTGTFTTDGETCTAAGYTTVEVASWMTSTGDRRAVALLIKTATGSETGTVTCTWGGGATTYTTIYQIYRGATTWTPGASDVDHGVGTGDSSTVSISGLPTSTTANVLTIGALVTRDNPGTVTMTNLVGQDSSDFNNCYTFTEYSYGDAVTDTVMSLSTAQQASGYLAQIACTD